MLRRNGPWQVTSSEVKYTNPWLRVREDRVVRPDGRPGIYGVVEYPGSVTVLAIDDTGRAPLVSQWRYPLERDSLELPTGAIDATDDTPLVAARRELREECGWVSGSWHSLGTVDNSNGTSDDTTHLFLAASATVDPHARPSDEDAATLQHHVMPLGEVLRAALTGGITAGPSVAATLRAYVWCRRDPASPPWSTFVSHW